MDQEGKPVIVVRYVLSIDVKSCLLLSTTPIIHLFSTLLTMTLWKSKARKQVWKNLISNVCKINWKIILIQQITLIHSQNRRTNIVNSPESIVCLTYTRWCFLNNLENGTEISMKLRESASKFDEKSKTARDHLDKINERSVKEGIKWNEQGQMKILQLWGTLPRSKKEDRDHFYQKEFKAWNVIINSPLLLKWVSTT